MILSNSKILDYIKKNKIFIGKSETEKIPLEELEDKFETTALKLHLGDEFTIWKQFSSGIRVVADPGAPGFSFKECAKDFTTEAHIDRDKSYDIRPREFLLCKTYEYVNLPIDSLIAARIEGRSSLGRLGLGVHITAPTIHAGFHGKITLEVFNHSNMPIVLRPGMEIAQLIFETVDGKPFNNSKSSFKGQNTTIGSIQEQKIKKIA